ncbi:MAG: hypothetical protein CL610_27665 [Anaerolineaceae bacterium]|nr:hypothetical protein [Anaerolineaceae bacterium]
MADQSPSQPFMTDLFRLLEETFEQHQGIYLDKGTSLFETLDTISAQEASQPVSATCASIAAQVAHVCFYVELLTAYMRGEEPGPVDWGEIWRTVEAVTPEEWAASKQRLRASYEQVMHLLKSGDGWNDAMADALAIVVHTAYHLGEIRQALCTLKPAVDN